MGSTLFEEVVRFPLTMFKWRKDQIKYSLNAQYVTSRLGLKIGTIAGGVTLETRRDGWILLCGRQGSAENLPQAEPVHTAVQAPDS